MAGLIDFFVPPRTDTPGYSKAWAQLADLLGPPGFRVPAEPPIAPSDWESLRPRFTSWELANSPLRQSVNWPGAEAVQPFGRTYENVPNDAADTLSSGRWPASFKSGPGPDEVFRVYPARTSANEPMSQAGWNIPPPEQSDLKPRAPLRAQMIEGRETGPSDSQRIPEPIWPATLIAPRSPDGVRGTGPTFSDWLLPSTAKPPLPSMVPFGLPLESAATPEAVESRISADPFDETAEPYRGLRPLRRNGPEPDFNRVERLLSAIGTGAREGFGPQPLGIPIEERQKAPLLSHFAQPLIGTIDTAKRSLQAAITGTAAGVEELAKQLGASDTEARRISREIYHVANVLALEAGRSPRLPLPRESPPGRGPSPYLTDVTRRDAADFTPRPPLAAETESAQVGQGRSPRTNDSVRGDLFSEERPSQRPDRWEQLLQHFPADWRQQINRAPKQPPPETILTADAARLFKERGRVLIDDFIAQKRDVDMWGHQHWPMPDSPITVMNFKGKPEYGVSSTAPPYEIRSYANDIRTMAMAIQPELRKWENIGRKPNNAFYHGETTNLLSAAMKNGKTLEGHTLEMYIDGTMCSSCEAVLPVVTRLLGSPTITFVDSVGRWRTLRGGKWTSDWKTQ